MRRGTFDSALGTRPRAAVTSFVYDADGQRLLRKTASDSVLCLDGQEVKLAGTALTVSRYYNHAGATVAQRTKTTSTETTHWLAGDHQGSFGLAVNASTGTVSKQRYLPFGAARGPVNQLPTDRGFIGQTEDDSTDLVYLNARYYDAKLGRFLSVDPLARPYQPATLDCYGYALSSPVVYADPSGLSIPVPEGGESGECDDGSETDVDGYCRGSAAPAARPEDYDAYTRYKRNPDGTVDVQHCSHHPLFIGPTCTDVAVGASADPWEIIAGYLNRVSPIRAGTEFVKDYDRGYGVLFCGRDGCNGFEFSDFAFDDCQRDTFGRILCRNGFEARILINPANKPLDCGEVCEWVIQNGTGVGAAYVAGALGLTFWPAAVVGVAIDGFLTVLFYDPGYVESATCNFHSASCLYTPTPDWIR